MERGIMFLRVVVGLTLALLVSVASLEEPICTSRFDYDHKMLQKMIMLEMEQNNAKRFMEDMKNILSNLKEENSKDRLSLEHIQENIRKIESVHSFAGTGNTYVRWGRTQCPENGTELVYKGYAGGSQHSMQGSSSNFLCLPENPLWNVYDDKVQSSATVWGAEYELIDRNHNTFFGKNLHDQDVPCCVCRTKRASVLFIPGRNKCYDGWTLEYEGYLTAGHDTHHASEFVCLDAKPEIIDGGEANENGKLFYFAEARCGSLKCPPYVNGRELTCAVCSR